MGLVFIPLYIKYIGIEAYGLIGLFAVLQSSLTVLDMGMRPTLNREMARFTGGRRTADSILDLLRSIEFLAMCVVILIGVGVAHASVWVATSWLKTGCLPISVVAQAITIMGVVSALRFAEGIYSSSLIGLQRQVLLNVINSSMATLRGLGAVGIVIWVSPTIQAFFLWQGLISLISLVILSVMTYSSLPSGTRGGRFSLSELRGVSRFASGMVGITLLALMLTQVDKVLLSRLLPLSDYGRYTLAVVVAGALYILVYPVSQAFYPRFTQLHAASKNLGLIQIYHQGSQLVSVLLGSAAIVLMVFSEIFLRLWTHDAELAHRVAPLLTLLALGNLLNGLMSIPYQMQLAHGWAGLGVRINAIAVLVIVPAILWVTPRYGAEGAAWVWVGLNAGYLLIGAHFMYRRILTSEKWRWYVRTTLPPLFAATITATTLRWMLPISESGFANAVALAAAAVITLIASVAAAPLLHPPLRSIAARILAINSIRI